MDSAENQPSETPENQPDNSQPTPAPENNPAPDGNLAPVNAVAETITAEDLLPKRGRGRPKGSKTKNRRADGKFASGSTETAPTPEPATGPAQFISEIPGQSSPAPAGTPGVSDQGNATAAASQAAPAPAPVDYRALAIMTVGLSTGILEKVIGPEWKPENEAEIEFLVTPLEAYLRVKQCPDIPPGAMLAIAIAAYSAKRLNAPTTKSRLLSAWLWLKSKFGRRKVAKIIPMPNGQTSTAPANAN